MAQVCALKYLPLPAMPGSPEGAAILFAVRDPEGLRLFAHPYLKQLISEADWQYIEELLEDFENRCQETPEDLFRQLSRLSVGPLLTDSVEWRDASEEALAEVFGLCVQPA